VGVGVGSVGADCSTGVSSNAAPTAVWASAAEFYCAVLAGGVCPECLALPLAHVPGKYADGLAHAFFALSLPLVVMNALQLGPIPDTEEAEEDPGSIPVPPRPTPPTKQQKRQQDKARHQPQHVQKAVQDADSSLAAAPTTPAAMKAAAAVAAAARASLCNGCSKSSIDGGAPQDAAANADAWAVMMPPEQGQQGAAAHEQEAEQMVQEQQVLLMQRCRCSADSGSSSCRTSSDTQQQQQPLQPDIELGTC